MASFFITPPAGLRFGNASVLITTFCGAGLIRWAPGTWGSLAAVVTALPVAVYGGSASLLPLAAFAFLAGIIATDAYCKASGREDPSEVVIDEVAAQWLVLALLPLTPLGWLLGFGFFRLFDIWKPWPIRLVDEGAHNAMGVMADDIVAGIYAILAGHLVLIAIGA